MPFCNREKEQGEIIDHIQNRARLITLSGRAGSGKTGLACKVLGDLEEKPDAVDGMVYLSANIIVNEISMHRIMTEFSKILPEAALYHDPQMPPEQKANLLINTLRQGRYVLLLDNVKTMQDANTHAITDEEIQALFDVVLRRGGLTIIVTTRYPLKLDALVKGYEKEVSLDAGLPLTEAIEFIRLLDDQKRLPDDDAPWSAWSGASGASPVPYKR